MTRSAASRPFEREVRLMYDGSLLALNGERKLSVSSRGVDELEYRLARVNPGEINHLVSQSEGSFASPVFNSDNFGESDLAETIVRRESIANTDAAQRNYSSFDFSEFVNGGGANEGKLGLFILHLYGRKTGNNPGYYEQDGQVLRDKDLANAQQQQRRIGAAGRHRFAAERPAPDSRHRPRPDRERQCRPDP